MKKAKAGGKETKTNQSGLVPPKCQSCLRKWEPDEMKSWPCHPSKCNGPILSSPVNLPTTNSSPLHRAKGWPPQLSQSARAEPITENIPLATTQMKIRNENASQQGDGWPWYDPDIPGPGSDLCNPVRSLATKGRCETSRPTGQQLSSDLSAPMDS